MTTASHGIVLFAHGSRDERWRAPVEAVARRVGELDTAVMVACAYLEMVAPDLPTAASELIARGALSVRVVPLFLGVGKHLREDLPKLVDGLRIAHPTVRFDLPSAVGEDADVVDLLARIALRNSGTPQDR